VPELSGKLPTEPIDAGTAVRSALRLRRSPAKELLLLARERLLEEVCERSNDPMLHLFQLALPLAYDTQLEVMVNAEKPSDRLAAAQDFMDRGGYAPVKKLAQKIQIEISPNTIKQLTEASRYIEEGKNYGREKA
jgi:hypothetical protein